MLKESEPLTLLYSKVGEVVGVVLDPQEIKESALAEAAEYVMSSKVYVLRISHRTPEPNSSFTPDTLKHLLENQKKRKSLIKDMKEGEEIIIEIPPAFSRP
jgi:hypothetical protein